MRSLAAGAIVAALVSVAAALTLLPALLEPARRSRQRAAHPVLRTRRRPRGEPVLVAHRARGDEAAGDQPRARHGGPARHGRARCSRCGRARPASSTLPDRLAAKQGYLALNAEFPGETTDPVEIVIDGDAASPAVQSGIERLRERLARDDRFGPAELETNRAGDLTVLTVPIQGDPLGAEAVDAVRQLRGEHIPAGLPGSGSRGARRRRHRRVDRRIRHDEPLASDRPRVRARDSASCC